jgi:hypothetical protein
MEKQNNVCRYIFLTTSIVCHLLTAEWILGYGHDLEEVLLSQLGLVVEYDFHL